MLVPEARQLCGETRTVKVGCRAMVLGGVQGLEKYLMTKLYSKVFAVSESDRERDEALARRMEVWMLLPSCNSLPFHASTATRTARGGGGRGHLLC